MKKIWKKVLSVGFTLTLLLSMATTAFAAETIKVNGYPDEDVSAEYQFSISNVVRKEANYKPNLGEVYICQGPVVITSLDKLDAFGVSTFVPMMDTYIEGEYLVADGYTAENWESYVGEGPQHPIGTKFTITEPGIYYAFGRYEALDGVAEAVFVIEGTTTTPTTPPATTTITATPTSSKILVNGAAVEFDAYTINGNNYFKLRDVAKVVSGSDKQFEVTWNGSKNAIELVSNQPYTVVGGEMAKGDGISKTATANTSTIYKDGVVVELTAYTINGNNYFKLRDLGQSFDFNVSWDGVNNCIVVNTAESYTAD